MITKDTIKAVAQLKDNAHKELLRLCDLIPTALKKFDGKSITGNKKRITDTLKELSGELYTSIEPEYFGTKLKVNYFPKNRVITTEGQTHYIKSDFFIIWLTVKDNILHIDEIQAEVDRTIACYTKYKQQTLDTAEHIEQLKERVEQLKNELYNLKINNDTELMELFGVRF